jgi:hypothetical protein
MRGLVHPANAAESSRQRNETPASASENANEALVAFVGDGGPDVIVGTGGGVVSFVTVHVYVASPLVLPPLTAWTRNVCEATLRPVYDLGLEQAANAPESSLHSNVAPDSPVKVNVALVEVVGFDGPEVIVGVAGAGAASASPPTTIPPSTRTPSKTARLFVALLAVLMRLMCLLRLRTERMEGRACARPSRCVP